MSEYKGYGADGQGVPGQARRPGEQKQSENEENEGRVRAGGALVSAQ